MTDPTEADSLDEKVQYIQQLDHLEELTESAKEALRNGDKGTVLADLHELRGRLDSVLEDLHDNDLIGARLPAVRTMTEDMPEGSDSSGNDTGRVGPIIFGNETARNQLLDEGEVYTFRTSDRTTGDTWARASRTGPKIADVSVEQVCSIPAPRADDLARKWARKSGFGTADRWWAAIEDVHGQPSVGYVYHVELTGQPNDVETDGGTLSAGTEPRPPDQLLAVDYITAEELRRLHPQSRPLPLEHELDDAECHNCGEPWDGGDEWDDRRLPSGPSAGETWKYQCPNCGFETFETGT